MRKIHYIILSVALTVIIAMTTILCFSCKKDDKSEPKTTRDAVAYNSSSLNQVTTLPKNNKQLSTSLKKGATCMYGEYDSYSDNFLSGLNPFQNVWDSFKTIFGANDEGLIFVIRTEEIQNCIVWIDYWTHNPNGGNTTVAKIDEESISTTIKTSLSAKYSDVTISHEKSVTTTKKHVDETVRDYIYDLKQYDTENYEYAWAVTATVSVYRIMCYRFDFWSSLWGNGSYKYVGDAYESRVNDVNPNWRKQLLYRPL